MYNNNVFLLCQTILHYERGPLYSLLQVLEHPSTSYTNSYNIHELPHSLQFVPYPSIQSSLIVPNCEEHPFKSTNKEVVDPLINSSFNAQYISLIHSCEMVDASLYPT